MRQMISSLSVRFGASLFATLVCQAVLAQGTSELSTLHPPSAVDCLIVQEGVADKPVYPPDQLRMKASARVRVRLTFERPDIAPRTTIVENSGAPEFGESVRDYVARYRLPCMRADAPPALVNQEFSFDPDAGRKVFYGRAEDAKWIPIKSACVSTGSSKAPEYPRAALRVLAAGNVLANVTFQQQDAQPEVDILYDAGSKDLARSVRTYLEGYRYTCPLPGGRSLVAQQLFRFRVENGTRYAFKDAKLIDFLAMVEPKGLGNAKFDVTKMGCPFDLSLNMNQPYARNGVGEIGGIDGSRKPLIGWLQGLTMKLPPNAEPFLIGEGIKVSVPCLVLDL